MPAYSSSKRNINLKMNRVIIFPSLAAAFDKADVDVPPSRPLYKTEGDPILRQILGIVDRVDEFGEAGGGGV